MKKKSRRISSQFYRSKDAVIVRCIKKIPLGTLALMLLEFKKLFETEIYAVHATRLCEKYVNIFFMIELIFHEVNFNYHKVEHIRLF